MKHSSHQIRGKCTLHFVLEPGIAGERVASAVSQSPPAAAASLAPFGRAPPLALTSTARSAF